MVSRQSVESVKSVIFYLVSLRAHVRFLNGFEPKGKRIKGETEGDRISLTSLILLTRDGDDNRTDSANMHGAKE
jgi:hypothetical protein